MPEGIRQYRGICVKGRGLSGGFMRQVGEAAILEELHGLLGVTWHSLTPGSLNVLLDTPLVLRRFDTGALGVGLRGRCCLAWVDTVACVAFRPRYAPAHVLELWSPSRLRDSSTVSEDGKLTIGFSPSDVRSLEALEAVAWTVAWAGRKGWYYSSDWYPRTLRRLQRARSRLPGVPRQRPNG